MLILSSSIEYMWLKKDIPVSPLHILQQVRVRFGSHS